MKSNQIAVELEHIETRERKKVVLPTWTLAALPLIIGLIAGIIVSYFILR